MRTGYDIFIDEVACAMEDHSLEIEWFYDFDAQTIVANMPFGDCHPENNHRLLPIEPLDSREGFRMMEDFVNEVKNRTDHDKLWQALNQRHPFSAFRNMLHYTSQREAWFEFKNEQMRYIVERWMRYNGITYENGLFKCDDTMTFECDEDGEDEDV